MHDCIDMSIVYRVLSTQECVECNSNFSTCVTRPEIVRGVGVPNTDLIIYVSINNCSDVISEVVAFAGACQLESQLDR